LNRSIRLNVPALHDRFFPLKLFKQFKRLQPFFLVEI